MPGELGSILRGTAALSLALLLALLLTVLRWRFTAETALRQGVLRLFQVGIALQCVHFLEEHLTGFFRRVPEALGLPAWGADFFITFNVLWIAVWILAVEALRRGWRGGLLPAWFFALAMAGNGIAHPLLALASTGYFPGLVTSPMVGVVGFLLLARLFRATARRPAPSAVSRPS